jgi:hypothetical protein
MSKPIDVEIDRLEQEIEERDRKIRTLIELKEVYPDLRVHRDKKDVVRYCSEMINGEVDTMDIGQSCSCCTGAAVVVWPFTIVDGVRIYSNPPHFDIGHLHDFGFGVVPNADWKAKLMEQNVCPLILKKVDDYLARHRPVSYDAVDEEEAS